MRATVYFKKQELEEYLERNGYTILTLRRIILKEFGYKNSRSVLTEHSNLCSGVLNTKLAYKTEDEYRNITLIVSDLILYLRRELASSTKPGYGRQLFGKDIIFLNPLSGNLTLGYNTGDRKQALYWYTMETSIKREIRQAIQEKTGIHEIGISI